MHSNQMLTMAREAIELVILRAQCEVAEHPADYLFNRIRDLHHAIELIDGVMSVVAFKESA
jgi:hypothetical protein